VLVLRNGILFMLFLLPGCGGKELPSVRVVKVASGDLAVNYVANGFVRSKSLRIISRAEGRIEQLSVKLHQSVKKGQLLVQLDDREVLRNLDSSQAELEQARIQTEEIAARLGLRQQHKDIQLAQARQDQRESELNLLETRRGATLEERQKLRETLRQAEEKVRRSEREWQRQESLFREEIVAQADLETAQSQYALDKSSYRQALAEWNQQSKGARSEQVGRLESRQQKAQLGLELLRSQEQEEMLLGYELRRAQADIRRAEAGVERQRQMLERYRIIAPVSGTISQLTVEEGEYIGHGHRVLELVTEGPYWVEAEVDEQDATHVRVGQAVEVSLTSLPGRNLKGKVSEVAASLESQPQGPAEHKVLRIRVELIEPVKELRSGLEADVEGRVELANQTLSVPRGALRRDQGKDYVLKISGGRLQRVDVRLGAISGDRAQVLEGLSAGDQVVVEGGDGLSPGSQVEIRP
jgi:HlyD family secretion protein